MSFMNNLIFRRYVLAGLLALGLALPALSNVALAQQRRPSSGRAATPAPARSRGPNVVSAPFGNALVSQESYLSPFAAAFSPGSQPSSNEDLRAYYQSGNRARLLNVPEMFGDFRRGGPSVTIGSTLPYLPTIQSEIPVAAAISGLRVGENNHALPSNRVWVAYNYFDTAYDTHVQSSFLGVNRTTSQSLHRSMIAAELLLDEGQTSVELRMPFGAAFGPGDVNGLPPLYSVGTTSVGNLNVLLKRLLYADGNRAVSAGLGIEAPTGAEGWVRTINMTATLDPKAAHLVPFVAFTHGHERWFGNGFMQLDVATQGDRLTADLENPGVPQLVGRINQQPLLGLDLGGGYWLLPPEQPFGSGLAIVGEVHYTTALGSSDSFITNGSLASVYVNNPGNAAYDLLNFTAGLQLSLPGGWRIRPAVVVPAKHTRVFDAEYLTQINRSF
jgi:hypothetical protein